MREFSTSMLFSVFNGDIYDLKFSSPLVAIIIIIIIGKFLVLSKFGVIIFLIHYSDLWDYPFLRVMLWMGYLIFLERAFLYINIKI